MFACSSGARLIDVHEVGATLRVWQHGVMSEQISHAGDAALFATCPLAERELLRSLAVPLRVPAGEDIVGQGDFGSTIGVLLEGRASVWQGDQHLADLQVGDCFGETAVLAPPGTPGQRSASVRADTEVRVDTIAGRELSENLPEIPAIADKLREQAAAFGHR